MHGAIYENKSGKGAKYFLRFKKVFKRSNNKDALERMLTAFRFKTDEGTFDARDYQKDQPLGFTNLSNKWLEIRKSEGVKSFNKLSNHIGYAQAFLTNKNIKEISYADLEDFFRQLPARLSSKTKFNIKVTLHAFWNWCLKRRVINHAQFPEFPEIKYDLKWRGTVSKDDQSLILEEIRRITWDINPKIWIGIKMLTTYISIRPNQLINIQEKDFNFQLGTVNIIANKKADVKTIPLLQEDIELIKSFPQALPNVYFFRHDKEKGVRKKTERFGPQHLWKYWRKACNNLGIEGIDLYGGTRHSSTRALRENFSPEQIKRATMHATNKAFERYFNIELDDVRKVYQVAHQVNSGNVQGSKGKILKLKE
jgi:hypothetical protein